MDESNDRSELGTWRAYSGGLFMRADETESGRLVRLVDVMRWLMHDGGLPVAPAAEALCEKLSGLDPAPRLYCAREETWASPLSHDSSFGYFTEASLSEARRRVQSIAEAGADPASPVKLSDFAFAQSEFAVKGEYPVTRETAPDLIEKLNGIRVVQPGLPAALRYIREHWAIQTGWWWWVRGRPSRGMDALEDSTLRTHSLCMRLQDAAAHFGFGAPPQAVVSLPPSTAFEDVAPFRRANKGAPWDPGHWDIVCNEIKRRGGRGKKGVANGVADDIGVTVRALNDRLEKHPIPDDGPGAGVVRHLMDGSRGRGGSRG
jgi:hypothetical protein